MAEGIFNKVFSLISRPEEPEDDRQVLLKQISRDIAQNKYARFYRGRQEELDPQVAQLVYGLYRPLAPVRAFFRDPARAARLGPAALEFFLDQPTVALIQRLTAEAVAERKKTAGPALSRELEADLDALRGGFEDPRLARADACYALLTRFRAFVSWDYGNLLRKFDPRFDAEDLPALPAAPPAVFAPARAAAAVDDLAAFVSLAAALDPQGDWRLALEFLTAYNGGEELIPFPVWNSLLANLTALGQSRIFTLILRLTLGNPIWEPAPDPLPAERFSAAWLEKKTAEVRSTISSLDDELRRSRIAALEQALFGGPAPARLGYYTPAAGAALTAKGFEGFVYAPALNHLALFIQDFLAKEMQDLGDIILVRGRWTDAAASRAMSDSYYAMMERAGEIEELDDSLSEEGSNGARLRGGLPRADRDRVQARSIANILGSVNEEALDIIQRTTRPLAVFEQHLRMLCEDLKRKPYELIMNWRELSLASKTPLGSRLTGAYKTVSGMGQLLALEIG